MKNSDIRIEIWGGVGDALLATPLFRALKEERPGMKTIVYPCSDSNYELYLHNPYIDRLKKPSRLSRAELYLLKRYRPTKLHNTFYTVMWPSLFYSKNATEIIAEMFEVTLNHKQLMVFLTKEEEEIGKRMVSPYAVPIAIHVTSRATSNQHWPTESWAELVRRNPGYTFLQLGHSDEQLIPGVVDLRGKTSLRIALAVLKHARAFVGVVSAFAHATNAFGIPGVVFYGPSPSQVWGHSNNRNLDLGLSCAPCVDLLLKSKCPFGSPCMSGISVIDVELALEQQLARALPQNQNVLVHRTAVSAPL
jgi:ADP-heptose:LPS heptosyltransferase